MIDASDLSLLHPLPPSPSATFWIIRLITIGHYHFLLPVCARFLDLRHRFATVLRQQDTDIKTIKRLGGWESGTAISRYLHVATPELATAANNFFKVPMQ